MTELLERRRQVQARRDAGEKPDFLPETKHVSGAGRGGAGARRWAALVWALLSC